MPWALAHFHDEAGALQVGRLGCHVKGGPSGVLGFEWAAQAEIHHYQYLFNFFLAM